MDLRGMFQKYEAILGQMAADRQKMAFEISKEAYALMGNRLTNEGVDYKGTKFKLYSDGYKAKRKALGLPVDKRTHVVTGDMFRSTRPEVVEHNDVRTVVEIKANDEENQKKLNVNSWIVDVNILKLNEDELKLIEELNTIRIQKYLK